MKTIGIYAKEGMLQHIKNVHRYTCGKYVFFSHVTSSVLIFRKSHRNIVMLHLILKLIKFPV